MLWTLDIHLIFVLSIGHCQSGKSSCSLSKFIFSILGQRKGLQAKKNIESA
ncbi:hypothetical protein GOZ66_23975 [Vibrio parahaemolyticus]|nr:hypothetical protein [Vibrio parahaemolyticus]PMT73550.1 hypothetical protein C1S93_04230 [Vibrio parahaemolyticus]